MIEEQIRPNYFEDLIDEEMIRTVSGEDQEIFEFLSSLSQDEQRPAILSVLDKNIGLFDKIMAIMNGEYIPKTEHITNVVEMMRKYVEVGETEKKKFGEVMTPIWLVEDILSKLPENVWSNPDLKWLDPANGCGVFPSVIVHKLMDGLSEWEPDAEARYKHIVENMLYVCELQAKNMFLHLCTFDPEDVYLLNIFHGSFLSKEFDHHMKNVWGVEGFDVIVGNPPYQELKPGFKKSNPIWHNFVMKTIENNSQNGFVSLIHPSGWRNVDGRFKNAQRHIMSNDILYLEMHSIKDGIKTFGASTPYDWYVLRNSKTEGLVTEIKCIDGIDEKRCLDGWEFIPGGMFDEIFSLMAKSDEEKTEVLHNSSYHTQRDHVSKEKTEEFIYPCIMNVNVKGEISKMYWSNTNKNGHFGIPKVIFGKKVCGTLIDVDGQYGLTQHAIGIVDITENLPMIKSALDSKKFIELMKYCDCGGTQDRYNHKVIALFRKDFWKEFV